MNWSVYMGSCSDINELTNTVSSSVLFCEEAVFLRTKLKLYADSKPWVTKNIRVLIKEHKIYPNDTDTEKRDVKREVRLEIKKAKLKYKDKIENELKSSDFKTAWDNEIYDWLQRER